MRDAGAQVRPDHATARRSEGDAPSRCLGNGRKRSISAAPLQNTRQTDLVGSLGLKSDRLLDDTIARMTEIVQLGVRFSIDDFGTGYSSLAYLKRLPLYELKIDKSFVDDTPDDPNDTAIVQSIISVARHLNLRVVAEGVETRAQADLLVESQCECLQGYLFGRPKPLAAWGGAVDY